MAETYNIKWTNHAPETILALNRLRCQSSLFDVVILCRSQVFRAHKLVLSLCSEYFEGLFTNFPSLGDSREPVIIMHQTSPQLFRLILDFMYSGEVEIPHSDLEPFMELAECLLIRGLRSFQHAAYEQPLSPSTTPESGDVELEGKKALRKTLGGMTSMSSLGVGVDVNVSADSPPPSPPETPPSPGPGSAVSQQPAADGVAVGVGSGGKSGSKLSFGGGRKRASHGSDQKDNRESKSKRNRRQRNKTADAVVAAAEEVKPLSGNIARSDSVDGTVGELAESKHLDENGEVQPADNEQPTEEPSQSPVVAPAAENGPVAEGIPGMELISTLIYRDTNKQSGGPQYVCAACGYHTVSRSYALTHERTHTGERPFPCRLNCGKFFTQTSSRNLHESKRRCLAEDRVQDPKP